MPAMLRGRAVAVFLTFAFAYFLSALLRAVTATLAPVFSAELQLGAADLGLLAGAYFLGFAFMQLPLGSALDRHGPRRVSMAFMSAAVLGCAAFAMAQGFAQLFFARLLIGVGVAACLMAPLTGFRRWLSPAAQLRANSWMLMSGSLGMLASTLPVQWLLPHTGWRGLFWLMAGCLALAVLLVRQTVPRDDPPAPTATLDRGYAEVLRHPVFRSLVPMGFFVYGGMIAMQALWAGPWLTQVTGASATGAASGLFLVNGCMLLAFFGWGLAMPRLQRRGWGGLRVLALAWPAGSAVLAMILWLGAQAGAAWWALWCVCTSVVSLSQPAVGQAFPAALAGRALSAFNLVIFAGVFAVQWGLGGLIDVLLAQGWPVREAYRAAFAVLLGCGVASGLWFWRGLQGSRHLRSAAEAHG